MNLAITERKKYEKVWKDPNYGRYSPGKAAIPIFQQMARKRGTLLDIGCGTGAAGLELQEKGWSVSFTDFVKTRDLKQFFQQTLWTSWKNDAVWEYGYCCDVMEHIPEEKVDAVLKNIVSHCKQTFFTIHFGPDRFGKEVGETLHLTVKPYIWWRDLLRQYGKLKDSRDMIGQGSFYLVAG